MLKGSTQRIFETFSLKKRSKGTLLQQGDNKCKKSKAAFQPPKTLKLSQLLLRPIYNYNLGVDFSLRAGKIGTC